MDFLELARHRCSIRGFEARAIPPDVLETILEAARLAPSASNRQPLHLIVLQEGPLRREINTAYARDWFRTAPVVIVVAVEPARAWIRGDGKNYADVDAAIALDHMCLCAADRGLGSCWVAAFDPARMRSLLGLPEGVEPVAMIALGYPVEPPRAKTRKPLGELVHRERW